MKDYPEKHLEKLKEYIKNEKFERTNTFSVMLSVIASRLNSMLYRLDKMRSSYRELWLSLSDQDKRLLEVKFEKQNI